MNLPERNISPEKREISENDSLAYQSYEGLNGISSERKFHISQFLNGDVLQLPIDNDYMMLTENGRSDLQQHRANLSESVEDNLDPTVASPEFRLAEVYRMKMAADMCQRDSNTQTSIDHLQELDGQLYGTIDKHFESAMFEKVWDIIKSKSDTRALEDVNRDLKEGFTFTAKNGETLDIPPLPYTESEGIALPELDDEVFQWIQLKLKSELAQAKEVFDRYATEVLSQREIKEFTPEDVVVVFSEALAAIGLSEINIITDENATALSWSSADSAIKVGLRRKNITSAEELLGVFTHEGYIHGGRHLNGKKLQNSYLANGLFTDADEDEFPDYLTFEEGLTTTCEKAIKGKKETWGLASFGHYLSISLASRGYDSRQVQEIITRLRIVSLTKQDAEVLDGSVISKASQATVNTVVRTFRGTPASKAYRTSSGAVLHYGKDKAYAAGKKIAIDYLNGLKGMSLNEKEQVWGYLLLGKFDPTNHNQAKYVETALKP